MLRHRYTLPYCMLAYNFLGRYWDAIGIFYESGNAAKYNYDALVSCMYAFSQLGRHEDALQLFQLRRIRRNISDSEDAAIVANCMFACNELGRYAEAIELFEQNSSIMNKHDGAVAIVNCMFAYNESGRAGDAIELFEQNKSRLSGNIFAVSCRVVAYSRLGRHKEAVKLFEQNRSKLKTDCSAIAGCMFACNYLGRYEESIRLFEQNKTVTALSKDAIVACMFAYNESDRHGKTVKMFEENRAVLIQNRAAIVACLSAYNRLDRHRDIVTLFEQNRSVVAENSSAVVSCIVAYYHLNRHDKIVELFEENMSMIEEATAILKELAVSVYILTCSKLGRHRDVMELYEKHVDILEDPSSRAKGSYTASELKGAYISSKSFLASSRVQCITYPDAVDDQYLDARDMFTDSDGESEESFYSLADADKGKGILEEIKEEVKVAALAGGDLLHQEIVKEVDSLFSGETFQRYAPQSNSDETSSSSHATPFVFGYVTDEIVEEAEEAPQLKTQAKTSHSGAADAVLDVNTAPARNIIVGSSASSITTHNSSLSYDSSLKSFLDILKDRIEDRPERVRKLVLAEGEALFNIRDLDYRDYILPKYIQTVSNPLYNYMDAINAELSVVFLVRDIDDLRRKLRDRSNSDELADYVDITISSMYRNKRRDVFNLDILFSVRDTLQLIVAALRSNRSKETVLTLIRELEALSMLHRGEYGKVESSMLTPPGNPSLSGNIGDITASASGQRLGGGNRLNVTSIVLSIACSLMHTHDAEIINTVFGTSNIFVGIDSSAVRKLVSDQMILNDKKCILFLLNKIQERNLDIDPDCINELLIALKRADVDVNTLNAFYRHFSLKLDLINEGNSRSLENRLVAANKFRDVVITPRRSVKWLMSRSRSSDIELYDKKLEELTAELTRLLPSGLDVGVHTRSRMIPIAMRIVINSAIAKSVIEVSTKHAFEDNITKEEIMKNAEEVLLSDINRNIRSSNLSPYFTE